MIKIDFFKAGMENDLSLMIREVYDEFVAEDYTDQGNQVFYDFIQPEKILDRFKNSNLILLAFNNQEIAACLEVRDKNHICLFFVRKKYQGQGIGRRLFNTMLSKIKAETRFLEVNSSLYAVKIYEALGFIKIGEIQQKNGIRFLPMQLKW